MYSVRFMKYVGDDEYISENVMCATYRVHAHPSGAKEVITYPGMTTTDGVVRQVDSYDFDACFVMQDGQTIDRVRPGGWV